MKPQETKYSFIYREIKQSIINGRILPGDCLPSSRMLCSQFHVSRYTINRVFDALKKEGLIDIKPRLAPIVLPGKVVSEPENMLFDVLSKRKVSCKYTKLLLSYHLHCWFLLHRTVTWR